MRDHRTTVASCMRLAADKGATVAERAAAKAMAEKLSSKYNIPLSTVNTGSEDLAERIRQWARQQSTKQSAPKPEPDVDFTRVGNIGDFCFQMLGRDLGGVGYSYEEVLRAVARRFPHSRTTINSLRWYETRMRKSGLVVPKRKKAPSNR